jgi:hypothetical protein
VKGLPHSGNPPPVPQLNLLIINKKNTSSKRENKRKAVTEKEGNFPLMKNSKRRKNQPHK